MSVVSLFAELVALSLNSCSRERGMIGGFGGLLIILIGGFGVVVVVVVDSIVVVVSWSLSFERLILR